jgi:hypothetical protein
MASVYECHDRRTLAFFANKDILSEAFISSPSYHITALFDCYLHCFFPMLYFKRQIAPVWRDIHEKTKTGCHAIESHHG